MTPCRDLNDEVALPGLSKSAYWSRDRKRNGKGGRDLKKNKKQYDREMMQELVRKKR